MPAVFHPMPWGLLYVEEKGDALTRIQFLRPEEKSTFTVTAETALLRETCVQLTAYGEGKLRYFNLPLAPQGTDFQLRVWEELCRIEWGQTRSYGDIARAVGSPRGARMSLPLRQKRSFPPGAGIGCGSGHRPALPHRASPTA